MIRALVCNSLGQLGPDLQNSLRLWALAGHAAKIRFLNLLDKPCIDSQTPDQATVLTIRKTRSFLDLQASDKILPAIFECVT